MTIEKTSPGVVIDDRYLLVKHLGDGGAAVVWEAKDRQTGQSLALKLLRPELRASEEIVSRLMREAEILFALDHPNIARAYAAVLDRAQPYFTMELLFGEPLETIIGDRAETEQHFSGTEILAVFEPVCSALRYAHARGVIHRDLKPGNVMIVDAASEDPDVKVLDFGIAKLQNKGSSASTTQGRIYGTFYYMSPEQVDGFSVDARSDIYALGVMLFEMLTLRRAWLLDGKGQRAKAFNTAPPGGGQNAIAKVLKRSFGEPRPDPAEYRASLSPQTRAVVAKALALDPDQRFESIDAFHAALSKALSEELDPTEAVGPVRVPGSTPQPSPLAGSRTGTLARPAREGPPQVEPDAGLSTDDIQPTVVGESPTSPVALDVEQMSPQDTLPASFSVPSSQEAAPPEAFIPQVVAPIEPRVAEPIRFEATELETPQLSAEDSGEAPGTRSPSRSWFAWAALIALYANGGLMTAIWWQRKKPIKIQAQPPAAKSPAPQPATEIEPPPEPAPPAEPETVRKARALREELEGARVSRAALRSASRRLYKLSGHIKNAKTRSRVRRQARVSVRRGDAKGLLRALSALETALSTQPR